MQHKRFGGGGADNKQSLKGFEPVRKNEEKLSHPTINCTSGVETKRSFKDFRGRILNFRRIGNEGKRKIAFTLSEVLITLSILGVVAAVTVPSIHRKWQDTAQLAQFRVAYSTLDNALRMAIAENGPITNWNWPNKANDMDADNQNYMGEMLSKYLNVEKYCGSESGCFPTCKDIKYCNNSNRNIGSTQYTGLNGQLVGQYVDSQYSNGKMKLHNGMALSFYKISSGLSTNDKYGYGLGEIRFDTNGNKGPNRYGYDVFFVKFNKSGLYLEAPGLYAGSTEQAYKANSCTPTSAGGGCSTWILKHGNMDYKYRNVSSEW